MTLSQKIRNNAEKITLLAIQSKILSDLILEDDSNSDKVYTLTDFTYYIANKIHILSQEIAKKSFNIKD